MLTLIWREILDHGSYLLLAAFLSVAMTSVVIYSPFVAMDLRTSTVSLVIPMILLALFGLCFLGVGQMYFDRQARISSFISTLSVTRGRILLARLIVGLLAILLVLGPVGVAGVVLLQKFMPPFGLYWHIVIRVYTTVFLTALACYSLGLNVGWHPRKIVTLFGALLLPAMVLALVAAKGYGWATIGMLLLVAVASVVAVAIKFCSTPL